MEENGRGTRETRAAHGVPLTMGKGEDGKHAADSSTHPPPNQNCHPVCLRVESQRKQNDKGKGKKLGQREFVQGAIMAGGG